MSRKNLLVASLSLCLLTYAASNALATNSIRNTWKTRYTTACSTLRGAADSCLLCHTSTNADNDNLNNYGQLLADNNRNYAAAESQDSDGDGRTNGQEILNDCTFPADAASPEETWSWGTIKAIHR
ncbi:MAG: hypothetical protein IPK64_15885 [bacterium]|nr:hypothetical protein [bacterium]